MLNQFKFQEGAKVTDIFSGSVVDALRRGYRNDCYDLSKWVCRELWSHGWMCSPVTFCRKTAMSVGGITVWSDLTQCHKLYEYHSVVVLGDCVLDLLHTDRLIQTPAYVSKLLETNLHLIVDNTRSGGWYTKDGRVFRFDVNKLISCTW